MESLDLLVIGGGAAGFFGGITAAESAPGLRALIVERGPHPLAKVRISGGGRCNVTHACFEPRALATRYPRGSRALISAFSRFQPSDTVAWFESRGVALKTESDGRMFPTTDQSESIVHCLLQTATRAGVQLRTRCGVDQLERSPDGSWLAVLSGAPSVRARRVLIATGGCRSGNVPALLLQLGHTLAKPVPSLFTFHVHTPWVQGLAGLALEAEAEIPAINLRERGPVLFTHWGLSGPAILRLSAWGARGLEETDYHFPLHISWLPGKKPEALHVEFQEIRRQHPGKAVVNLAAGGVPARLWEVLCRNAGISSSERWNQLPRTSVDKLIQNLLRTELQVTGKSLHKDEFVTCGGVRLQDVDLRSMESRITPALYFAGEVLDIDGITGGFNFQAAWTTGWIAGRAIAMQPPALF